MKKEKIIDTIFILIGIIGFIEFSFIRGLFTGPVVMCICSITGIIAVIYALLFLTIFFGYYNIM